MLFVAVFTSGTFFDPSHKTKLKGELTWSVLPGNGDCTNGAYYLQFANVHDMTITRK